MQTDVLYDLLKNELTTSSQFLPHAVMLKLGGYEALSDYTRRKFGEAAGNAEALATRALMLDGIPCRDVKAQLERDLAVELDVVPRLAAAIRAAVEAGDDATRKLLEAILVDAEHHLDWLEAQLHLIAEIGVEAFFAQQTGE